jgi:hypothetical protein
MLLINLKGFITRYTKAHLWNLSSGCFFTPSQTHFSTSSFCGQLSIILGSCGRSGCVDLCMLNQGTRWRWVVTFMHHFLNPREKSLCYPLGGRLVGIWRKEMSVKFEDLTALLLKVLVLLDVKHHSVSNSQNLKGLLCLQSFGLLNPNCESCIFYWNVRK